MLCFVESKDVKVVNLNKEHASWKINRPNSHLLLFFNKKIIENSFLIGNIFWEKQIS